MPQTVSASGKNTMAKAGESIGYMRSGGQFTQNPSLMRKKRNGKLQYHDECATEETTKNKLSDINFKHDDLDQIQHECNCRRHTFKLQTLKPDLTLSSSYQNSFHRSKPIPNVVNKSKQYDKLQGPHIGLNSNYQKSYNVSQGDKLQRPKPQDLLKTGGPSPFLTSYTSGFPGHRTVNQYVKPTESYVRGSIAFANKSTYAKQFGNRSCPKPMSEKMPDSLKFNPVWLGQTSYKNKFRHPNPEDYAKKIKNTEQVDRSPNYKRQYETTYKNNFLSQQPVTCPAKQKLQRNMKGSFINTKDRFAENSDFKSLAPDFHAISTSKHSYI